MKKWTTNVYFKQSVFNKVIDENHSSVLKRHIPWTILTIQKRGLSRVDTTRRLCPLIVENHWEHFICPRIVRSLLTFFHGTRGNFFSGFKLHVWTRPANTNTSPNSSASLLHNWIKPRDRNHQADIYIAAR